MYIALYILPGRDARWQHREGHSHPRGRGQHRDGHSHPRGQHRDGHSHARGQHSEDPSDPSGHRRERPPPGLRGREIGMWHAARSKRKTQNDEVGQVTIETKQNRPASKCVCSWLKGNVCIVISVFKSVANFID